MTLASDAKPTVDQLVDQIAELCPLGGIASAVLRITDGDRFSAHELGKVISSDQALTARMLRLSNSAYYGFPRRVTTVRDAIVLLGFRAVRSSVLASCVIADIGKPENLDYQQFWRNSVSVAMLGEMLAKAEHANAEEVFTAGVLHNIGRLALDQQRPDLFRELRRHASKEGVDLHEAQLDLLGFSDAEIGGELARRWNFPEELADAVEHHALNVYALPEQGSLTAYVVRARVFARSYGMTDGADTPSESAPPNEWTQPPLSTVLMRTGGIDGVKRRVGAFLEMTLA